MEIIKKKWFRIWVLLIVLSSLISFIGVYLYIFFVAILMPLAQLIGLYQIQTSRNNLLWLVQIPYWIYVLNLNLQTDYIAIFILLNSILGEILLALVFRRFGKFIWTILNTIALIIIWIGIEFSGENDFLQILILILTFTVAAVLMGFGLYLGFLRKKSTHHNNV